MHNDVAHQAPAVTPFERATSAQQNAMVEMGNASSVACGNIRANNFRSLSFLTRENKNIEKNQPKNKTMNSAD